MVGRRRKLIKPILAFIQAEVSGGICLLLATIAALIWANTSVAPEYFSLWKRSVGVESVIEMPLSLWINDGLMAIFFFRVGLEIKRELLVGELATRQKATLPILAAFGGMIVPALCYVALNAGSPTARGWGIPMATDIAFALGVLSLGGKRVPLGLKVFLTALAIVDDLGAVLVIAVFYSSHLRLDLLGLGILALLATWGLARYWVPKLPRWVRWLPFVVMAIPIWLLFLNSGVHATVAGVLLALTVPVVVPSGEEHSLLETMEHALNPWVTFLVVPVFAFANAGVAISEGLGQVLAGSEARGIALGLVLGKVAGISLFSWIAIRYAKAELPNNVRWKHMIAAGILGGIGFTMSLFVTELAFPGNERAISEGKAAILVASTLSAGLGLILLRVRFPRRRPPVASSPPA